MESKDRLEKFIADNKLEFGPSEPHRDLWSGIETRKVSESSTSGNWKVWLARAASVVVIFTLAYVFFTLTNNNTTSSGDNFISRRTSPEMIDLIEANDYYSAIISDRKTELFKLTESSPAIREDVNRDLDDLDVILEELQNDLQDNAANAEVIQAMMENYRLKLEILDDLLEQVQINNNKNQNEKGISI